MENVKKVYVLENGHLTIDQITDEIACVEDLEAWSCVSIERFEGFILQTINGLVRWFARSTFDELGFEDVDCGYESVCA